MKATTATRRLRPHARAFVDCLREFLTPALYKQVHQQRHCERPAARWATQPLVLVLLVMTWCCGDSQPERFETARAFCVALRPKRRRPGKTVQGFQKALAQLPTRAVRAVAGGIRKVLAVRLASQWSVHGFIPLGCDGSRLACPRARELEQRLGRANKAGAAPSLWVTALVHVRLGVPWAWRLGKGTASERQHLLQLLPVLPAAALVIADAGYAGFAVAHALVQQPVCFLLRMSSNVTLYTGRAVVPADYREGVVYPFPARHHPRPAPLRLRLIRVRAKRAKDDVWLLTNVLDHRRRPAAIAAQFYRWRWESEGQFRAYKRTLAKTKLVSRTVRLVQREAEGSLLALQLMLAQGVLAVAPRGGPPPAGPAGGAAPAAPVCSPRKVLLAIRAELYGRLRRGHATYHARLQAAVRERRPRTSAKAVRAWPRRKPHRAPKPPRLRTLTEAQKALISRLKDTAA